MGACWCCLAEDDDYYRQSQQTQHQTQQQINERRNYQGSRAVEDDDIPIVSITQLILHALYKPMSLIFSHSSCLNK